MAELQGGTGFVGFEALAAPRDDSPVLLAPEFQVVVKQLGKKDTTTKLKVSSPGCWY